MRSIDNVPTIKINLNILKDQSLTQNLKVFSFEELLHVSGLGMLLYCPCCLLQLQAAEIGFYQKFHGISLCDKVCCCGKHKALIVKPILTIPRSSCDN